MQNPLVATQPVHLPGTLSRPTNIGLLSNVQISVETGLCNSTKVIQ